MIGPLVAALAGRRALLNPGWSEMDQLGLPGNILRISAIPHRWLFPRPLPSSRFPATGPSGQNAWFAWASRRRG